MLQCTHVIQLSPRVDSDRAQPPGGRLSDGLECRQLGHGGSSGLL